MKKRIIPVILLAVAAITILTVRQRKTFQAGDGLRVSGNIEITDAELSFRIPGRVEARLISEGETVCSNQAVARLDSSDLLREVEIRRAEQAACAALADLTAAEEKRTKSEYARQKELYDKKVISDREFEMAVTAAEIAGARRREAEARLEQVKQAFGLAELRLGYATIVSPFSGLILSHHIEAGEYVVPGTAVLTVGDMEHAWLRAYINESDLGLVKAGQSVRVTTDTWPGQAYEGKVSFISSEAEFTPKNVQTAKERTKLVYRIKIDIPNPRMELKPGMPADAVIMTGPAARNK